MFAVIKTGGKQYEVKEGQKIKVEKLELETGSLIEFDALITFDENAKNVTVGKPIVEGVKVKAKVEEHGRDKKVSVIKYKPKSRYRRNVGHRQPYTKLSIEKITS
jgi:large subunit ribosomal protein L21